MGVMNCANNLAIMTVEKQDHSDEARRHVYVLREEGQSCAQEEGDSVVVGSSDEINNFFMHSYYSKTGNYVKLKIVSMKWKN